MPQFPFHPNSPENKDSSTEVPSAIDPPVAKTTRVESDQGPPDKEQKPRTPIKFKSIESKGPVVRKRINESNVVPESKSSKKKQPFQEANIFEDPEALINFRDNFGRPFALIVAVVALVSFIYWFSNPVSRTIKFEKKIAPLLAQADEIESQGLAKPEPDSQQLQKQIEVANKLLEFSPESIALDRGAELKLMALATWATTNMKNNIQDEAVRKNLEETSREYISSRNRTVSNHAKIGLTINRVLDYLNDPKVNNFSDILQRFKLVGNFASGDRTSAKNLLNIAHVFSANGLNEEAQDLYRVVSLFCSTSQNADISGIGIEARQRLISANSVYDRLKSMASEIGTMDLNSIRETIGENTQEDTISTAGMESILEFLEYMAEKNAVPATRALLSDIYQSIKLLPSGIQRESIQKKYDSLSQRVNSVGQTFDFAGLFSVEGRPISRGSLKQQKKIILFWSPENQDSIDLLKKVSSQYLLYETKKIQIIAIANLGLDNKLKAQVNEISNNTRGLEFLTLRADNNKSQAFINRMPVPKLPYWILLDMDDKVNALNTAVQGFEINSFKSPSSNSLLE